MKRLMLACLFVSLAIVSTGAVAKKEKDETPITKIEAGAFDAQRKAIVDGFASGERYAEISSGDKAKVMSSLDRIDQLLGDHTEIDALRADEKVSLYNEQEIINNILTKAQKDSREVCKRHRPVNSRLAVNECHTVAEWERRRTEARDLMQDRQRLMTPGGG